jgi:hypothetical protein
LEEHYLAMGRRNRRTIVLPTSSQSGGFWEVVPDVANGYDRVDSGTKALIR